MGNTVSTVTEQIYRQIRLGIINGELPAGEKLTIKLLNEMYGVSSSPIREALTRLQEDGLIEYKPNVGMRVITLNEQDCKEIFLLLGEFDIIAMRFAMLDERRDELISELESTQKKCVDFVNTDDWEQASFDFHLIFYKYADNKRLDDAARKIRSQFSMLATSYENIPEYRVELNRQHGEILDALKADDIQKAEGLLRAHLESSFNETLNVGYNK